MKRVVLMSVLSVSAAFAAEVWTNRSGVAFSAKLVSVGDTGAEFVFSEDGATNVLQFVKLSQESVCRACDMFDFAPVPPGLVATYERASSDLKRIEDLVEDGLLTSGKAKKRVDAVCRAFRGICGKKGVDTEVSDRLEKRLRLAISSQLTH